MRTCDCQGTLKVYPASIVQKKFTQMQFMKLGVDSDILLAFK